MFKTIQKNKAILYSPFAILHIFSIFSSYILSEIYFFSSKGVDFPVYKKYLDYFLYDNIQTENNQGLIYYFVNSIIVFLRKDSLNSLNEIIFFNSTIQLTNFILYIVGTVGLFKLLKSYKYDVSTIFLSLSLLHWVPKIIELRVLLKPEIIAFSFLPWIILGIDDYFENNNKKSLLLSFFPLSLILTSKGSISGMIIIFIFIRYVLKLRHKELREIMVFLLIFFVLCLSVGYENYNFHDTSFFGIKVLDNYKNVASIGFLTNLNLTNLITSPTFGSQNDSFIGITLLDLFGDYYNVNLGSNNNYFYYNQINIFESIDENGFSRNYIELLSSIAFIFLLIKTSNKNKTINLFLLSPLIGAVVLLLNSYGFPSMNFDPLKGDTVKVSYYAFFISLSFVFLICELLKNRNVFKNGFIIFLTFSMIYILGFPKNDYSKISENIDTKIEVSLFCKPLTLFNPHTSPKDCNNVVKKSCEYNLFSNEAQNIDYQSEQVIPEGFTRIYREDTILGEIVPDENLSEFLNEGGYSLTPLLSYEELKYINPFQSLLLTNDEEILNTDNVDECKELFTKGYRPKNEVLFDTKKIPYINIVFLFGSLYLIIYQSSKRVKNN